MTKIKLSLYKKFVVFLAGFIALAVMLVSVHAKDMVYYRDHAAGKDVQYQDISEKSVKELHDHVDKQVLKQFSKVFSDTSLLTSRQREEIESALEDDPGLWGRLADHVLLWYAYLTLPFSARS